MIKVDLENYIEMPLEYIKKMRSIIESKKIDILSVSSNGVTVVIPSSEVSILFDNYIVNSKLMKRAKFMAEKVSHEIIENEIQKIKDSGEEEASGAITKIEVKDFYNFYPVCEANMPRVRKKEEAIVENLMYMTATERIEHFEKQHKFILREKNKAKLDHEGAKEITNILTELKIAGRIDILLKLKTWRFAEVLNGVTPDTRFTMKKLSDSILYDIVSLFEKPYEIKNIFYNLEDVIDSHLIAHENRVFIMLSEFMIFYNGEFNSGLGNRLRVDFKNIYFPYYERIMEKLNDKKIFDSINECYELGVRFLSKNEINHFALASFWHDIAKAKDIDDIFISKDSPDYETIRSHTINGYHLFKFLTSNKDETSLIVGLHHEQFGYGYGMYDKFLEDAKRENENHSVSYPMTFDTGSIENATAFGYFPAKVLEIIDLYDSLRFPSKSSPNAPMDPRDIVSFMRENFIEKEVRLDPIIFNIFLKYLSEIKQYNVLDSSIS